MSKYINVIRIKGDKFIGGHVNIPYGTECKAVDGVIITNQNGKDHPICLETSERAYRDFAYNEDGNGIERKKLINDCIDIMSTIPDKDVKFGFLFDDQIAMQYKKHPEDKTEWSWDRFKVHTAPIDDLRYLKNKLNDLQSLSVMKEG